MKANSITKFEAESLVLSWFSAFSIFSASFEKSSKKPFW